MQQSKLTKAVKRGSVTLSWDLLHKDIRNVDINDAWKGLNMWVQKKDENKKLQEIIKSNQITRELYRNFVEKRDIENLTSQLSRIHQEDVAFLISSLFTHKLLNDKEMRHLVGNSDSIEDIAEEILVLSKEDLQDLQKVRILLNLSLLCLAASITFSIMSVIF